MCVHAHGWGVPVTKRALNIPSTCSHPCQSALPGTVSKSAGPQRAAGEKHIMTKRRQTANHRKTTLEEEVWGNKMFLTVANLIKVSNHKTPCFYKPGGKGDTHTRTATKAFTVPAEIFTVTTLCSSTCTVFCSQHHQSCKWFYYGWWDQCVYFFWFFFSFLY